MQEEQVVREHAQHLLGGQGRAAARGECGAQPTLVAGEDTLDLLALAVERLGERAPHGPAIGRAGPAATGGPPIERHGRRGHPQFLAAESMDVLGVVAGVGRRRPEAHQGGGLPQHRGQGRGVGRRPPGGQRAGDQMRARVHDDCQLGIPRPMVRLRRGGARMEPGVGSTVGGGMGIAIVGAGMPRVEPGGVHRRDGPRGEEPRPGRPGKADLLDPAEGPPFSAPARSRCAA